MLDCYYYSNGGILYAKVVSILVRTKNTSALYTKLLPVTIVDAKIERHRLSD
jgi:hypothetical protein